MWKQKIGMLDIELCVSLNRCLPHGFPPHERKDHTPHPRSVHTSLAHLSFIGGAKCRSVHAALVGCPEIAGVRYSSKKCTTSMPSKPAPTSCGAFLHNVGERLTWSLHPQNPAGLLAVCCPVRVLNSACATPTPRFHTPPTLDI